MIPFDDERICDKYGSCFIPFYECTVSDMGVRLPLTIFKVEVLNHLVMAPS